MYFAQKEGARKEGRFWQKEDFQTKGTFDYITTTWLYHNQGSTDIFAMLQTLNLRLTPFIVAFMMLNHATTHPVSVI